VTIKKCIAVPLTVCAAAGGVFMGGGAPAQAAGQAAGTTGRPAVGCAYRVPPARPGGYLDVRSGPGTGYQPVGRLGVADGGFTGDCRPANGWTKVKASNGTTGWVPATDLRRVRGTKRAALGSTYRVSHVRAISLLHVRSGPGVGYRTIGSLRVADGRFAGACRSHRGWTKVRASNGKTGWAATYYLRRASR
jgi:uncharacterized protein YgiM (DUF1202 family)